MQNAAFAGMSQLRGLYPVHKGGGLQAAAGANTTVMPAKRQKSASTPMARPSARAPAAPPPQPPLFSQQSATTSCRVLRLSVSCFQIPTPSFQKKTIPQNHRDGNFENNFPLLNNIIWELVFFTLPWYHLCLCSEQIYSALCYLLTNSDV